MKPTDFEKYKKSVAHNGRAAHSKLEENQKNQAGGTAPYQNQKPANHSHAWRGTWDRPMKIDEDTQHPFTIARMTDHNVRARD